MSKSELAAAVAATLTTLWPAPRLRVNVEEGAKGHGTALLLKVGDDRYVFEAEAKRQVNVASAVRIADGLSEERRCRYLLVTEHVQPGVAEATRRALPTPRSGQPSPPTSPLGSTPAFSLKLCARLWTSSTSEKPSPATSRPCAGWISAPSSRTSPNGPPVWRKKHSWTGPPSNATCRGGCARYSRSTPGARPNISAWGHGDGVAQ